MIELRITTNLLFIRQSLPTYAWRRWWKGDDKPQRFFGSSKTM